MDIFKIFKKEPREEQLSIEELPDWFAEISEDVLKEPSVQIKKTLHDFQENIEQLKGQLSELEEAELLNPNIPEREKTIMNGNRINYIQQTNTYLNNINLPEQEFKDIEEFCQNFEAQLKNFNASTSKGYFVLTNYFDKEMREIATMIKHMEDNVINVMGILRNEGPRSFLELSKKITDINKKLWEKRKMESEISELQSELEQAEAKRQKLQEKALALKESRDFDKFFKYEKDKQRIEQEISELSFSFNNTLKKIDKPLKKFMHASKKDIIDAYLSDPLDTLEKDKELEILKILDKLRQEIKKGHLDVKKKQLQQIDKVSEDYLLSVREEYRKLSEQKKEILDVIDKLTVMMDYKELEYQAQHIHDKIIRLNEQIAEKKDAVLNLDLDKKINQLQLELSDFTGNTIIIS